MTTKKETALDNPEDKEIWKEVEDIIQRQGGIKAPLIGPENEPVVNKNPDSINAPKYIMRTITNPQEIFELIKRVRQSHKEKQEDKAAKEAGDYVRNQQIYDAKMAEQRRDRKENNIIGDFGPRIYSANELSGRYKCMYCSGLFTSESDRNHHQRFAHLFVAR